MEEKMPPSCSINKITDDPSLLNLDALQQCKHDLNNLKAKTQNIPHNIRETLGEIEPLSSQQISSPTEQLFQSVDTSTISSKHTPEGKYVDENGSVWTDETIVKNPKNPKKSFSTGKLFASIENNLF